MVLLPPAIIALLVVQIKCGAGFLLILGLGLLVLGMVVLVMCQCRILWTVIKRCH